MTSEKQKLLNEKQKHTNNAEKLIQNNGMTAISTFNAHRGHLNNYNGNTNIADQKTKETFRINNGELSKRLKTAEAILQNPEAKETYQQMKKEINIHIRAIKKIKNALSSLG